MYGPAVCCKRKPLSGGVGSCTIVSDLSVERFANAPGHHGYERAFDLISGQTPRGLLGSSVLDCAGKTGPPLRWFTLSQTSVGKRCQAGIWQPPRYFPVRLKMAFPRPGRAPFQGRRAEAWSRPARLRAARKGLALMRQGAAPSLGMLGLIGMAHLEITPVPQHRPSDTG